MTQDSTPLRARARKQQSRSLKPNGFSLGVVTGVAMTVIGGIGIVAPLASRTMPPEGSRPPMATPW